MIRYILVGGAMGFLVVAPVHGTLVAVLSATFAVVILATLFWIFEDV